MMEQNYYIKLKKLHPKQELIMRERKRFNVLKCGRRFGKTEVSKELVAETMLEKGSVGYWTPTYKDLDKVWNEICFTFHDIIEKKDSSLKKLTIKGGGSLDMWSMEDPNSGRGFFYKRAIIDEAEKARKLKDAWEQTIRPTLVDLKGDAYFLSTPKFGKTYFKDVLWNNEKTNDNWKSFKFTSYDNPHIDPLELEEAKLLDELTFRCEYLAEDVDVTLRPFAYAFEQEKTVKETGQPKVSLPLYFSFDFNTDPITCIVAQHAEDKSWIKVHKEFSLRNSNIEDLCDELLVEYGDKYFIRVTGDASGKSRSALLPQNMNYYTIIQKKLNLMPNRFFVPSANPSIKNNRVLLNSLFYRHKDLIIDPSCKNLISDLKYVEVDDNGNIQKDRSSDTKKADLLDCLRYYFNAFHGDFIKVNIK